MPVTHSESPSLALLRVPITPDSTSDLSCPDCGGPLDVMQPDVTQPERLLGVCLECKTWALIAVPPHGEEVLLALLPHDDSLWALESPTDAEE